MWVKGSKIDLLIALGKIRVYKYIEINILIHQPFSNSLFKLLTKNTSRCLILMASILKAETNLQFCFLYRLYFLLRNRETFFLSIIDQTCDLLFSETISRLYCMINTINVVKCWQLAK